MNMNTSVEKTLEWIGACACALALGSTPAFAASAEKTDPAKYPDESWISISGTVVKTAPDAFRLDHGGEVITVEMDDFDFYQEGRQLVENDRVVVYGRIDADVFQKRTIEASAVYVQNLQTQFYANPADEEEILNTWVARPPVVLGDIEVTGTVTSVTGREFTVDTGPSAIQVDTIRLGFNPLDEDGYLKIEKGDRVKVSGVFDYSVVDETELSADWITELAD